VKKNKESPKRKREKIIKSQQDNFAGKVMAL
jgi:hypothetical protein